MSDLFEPTFADAFGAAGAPAADARLPLEARRGTPDDIDDPDAEGGLDDPLTDDLDDEFDDVDDLEDEDDDEDDKLRAWVGTSGLGSGGKASSIVPARPCSSPLASIAGVVSGR